MEAQQEATKRTCPFCEFYFSTVSAKNRHIKEIHKQPVEEKRNWHVICPLCRENKFICGTYNKLQTHLKVMHDIKLHVLTFNFSSKEMCDEWLREQKIKSNYVMHRTKRNGDDIEKHFICNRSNSTGYKSNYTKRAEKANGSIKMYGVCPSRIIIKCFKTEHSVTFCKTHVGHGEEIRSQQSSNSEKASVVEKSVSDVRIERTVSDSMHGEGSSSIHADHNEETDKLVKTKDIEIQEHEPEDEEMKRQRETETFINFLNGLDDDIYTRCMKGILIPVMEQINKATKRKLEKQDPFPAKRKNSVD